MLFWKCTERKQSEPQIFMKTKSLQWQRSFIRLLHCAQSPRLCVSSYSYINAANFSIFVWLGPKTHNPEFERWKKISAKRSCQQKLQSREHRFGVWANWTKRNVIKLFHKNQQNFWSKSQFSAELKSFLLTNQARNFRLAFMEKYQKDVTIVKKQISFFLFSENHSCKLWKTRKREQNRQNRIFSTFGLQIANRKQQLTSRQKRILRINLVDEKWR